jgi:hypothetical protein
MDETMTDDARWEFWTDRVGTFTDVVARRPDGSSSHISCCLKIPSAIATRLCKESATCWVWSLARQSLSLPTRVDGTREEFGATCKVAMRARDIFVVQTPGGGYRSPE